MELFHLHLFSPDPQSLDARLRGQGFERAGVYGMDGPLALDLDLADPGAERLRLVDLRRGPVSLVVMPGKGVGPWLEHIGLRAAPEALEAALRRAEQRGWGVQRRPHRSFMATPFGFRVELSAGEGGGIASLTLGVDDPEACAAGLAEVLERPRDGAAIDAAGATLRFVAGAPRLREAHITGLGPLRWD